VAVLAELKSWLWEQATLKTLSIGKAAAYMIANWDRLTRFGVTEHARSWAKGGFEAGWLMASAMDRAGGACARGR
jgi:hypothetical protein